MSEQATGGETVPPGAGFGLRRRAGAAGVVLAWCAAVSVAATAGWLVVDRAGSSLLESAGVRLAAGPQGGGAAKAVPAVATGVDRPATLSTAGGRVSAVCSSNGQISLQEATPTQGWRMQVVSSGPQRLRVDFKTGDSGTEREVSVRGVCRGSTVLLTRDHDAAGASPTGSATSGQPGSGHGGHGGDDSSTESGSGKGTSGGSGRGGDDSGTTSGSGHGGGSGQGDDDSGSGKASGNSGGTSGGNSGGNSGGGHGGGQGDDDSGSHGKSGSSHGGGDDNDNGGNGSGEDDG